MRVDIYLDHLSDHEKVGERQMHAAANRWCKKNWNKTADECYYRGMGWTTYDHVDYAQGRKKLSCSVFIPGKEMVVIVVQEKGAKNERS